MHVLYLLQTPSATSPDLLDAASLFDLMASHLRSQAGFGLPVWQPGLPPDMHPPGVFGQTQMTCLAVEHFTHAC